MDVVLNGKFLCVLIYTDGSIHICDRAMKSTFLGVSIDESDSFSLTKKRLQEIADKCSFPSRETAEDFVNNIGKDASPEIWNNAQVLPMTSFHSIYCTPPSLV